MSNSPAILFRGSLAEENELEFAKKYFDVIESRTNIKKEQLVIGRYSVLPYYTELEKDISNLGGQLINSHLQHQMVSDIQNWYPYFEDITPRSWFRLEDVPSDFNGPYFLKGNVNSRKQLFKTHSYAANRNEMLEVYFRLMEDSLISHQGVCIREFVDFKNLGDNDITGCPISKEFRIFIYKNQVVDKGFYWSQFEGEFPDTNEIPQSFIDDCIKRFGDNANFWTLDVGQLSNGQWNVVELGDAQMAGLSEINPDSFYCNLKALI